MPRTGRPQRGAIEAMRTNAWFAYVKQRAGVSTAYGVAKQFNATADKHFEKYQRGTISPNATSLIRIDKKWPGTRAVYDIGPLWVIPGVGSVNVPLWKALAGTIEETWEVLVWFDPELEKLRVDGAPYFQRIERVLSRLSPHVPLNEASLRANSRQDNEVARLCQRKLISLDMQLLVGVTAMWRYSMFIGDGWREMDYVVRGLCIPPGHAIRPERIDGRWPLPGDSLVFPDTVPVVPLLHPWAVGAEFLATIDRLRKENVDRRFKQSPELARMVTLFPGDYRR